MSRGALSAPASNLIYDALVEHAGAAEAGREDFVYSQTAGFVSEYRFCGSLGFGGKFWRNHTLRTDGTFGETWYVSTYPELETPAIRAAIKACDSALADLRSRFEKETAE